MTGIHVQQASRAWYEVTTDVQLALFVYAQPSHIVMVYVTAKKEHH